MHKNCSSFRKNFVQYAEMAFTFKMWNRATKHKYGASTLNYVRGSSVQKKREKPKPLSLRGQTYLCAPQATTSALSMFYFLYPVGQFIFKINKFFFIQNTPCSKDCHRYFGKYQDCVKYHFVYLSLFLLSLLYHFSIGLSSTFLKKYEKTELFYKFGFPANMEAIKMNNKQVGYGLIKSSSRSKSL